MNNDLTDDKISEGQKELALRIDRLVNSDGTYTTAIASLRLSRVSNVTETLRHFIYEPSLVVIAQGSKIVMLAGEVYQYDPTSYLVASVRLPISGRIIQATPQTPFLCVKLSFSSEQIFAIIKESDHMWRSRTDVGRGLLVNKTKIELLDAVIRLVRLLDTPQDISILSPLIIREILYRILQDEQGNLIQSFALIGSHAQCIAKVIQMVNRDFAKPLRIEELARSVNMSISSLHNQFKKVTAMSPLQYQKLIRLQEARRLLLTESLSAAEAGFQVGYESPSQFSREYARKFGLPPISDVKQLRDSLI